MTALPAHEVSPAESLLCELDSALTADFKDDTLVLAAYVGIAPFGRAQIRIGIGVCLGKIHVRHADTVTQLVDRFVKIRLGNGSEFCLGFGKHEHSLAETEDRKVVVRLVKLVI